MEFPKKKSITNLLTFVLIIYVNQSIAQVEKSKMFNEMVTQSSLRTGVQFEILKQTSSESEIETLVEFRNKVFRVDSYAEAMAFVPEDKRFLSGHLGSISRSILVEYYTAYKPGDKFLLKYYFDKVNVGDNSLFSLNEASPSLEYLMLKGGGFANRSFVFKDYKTEKGDMESIVASIKKEITKHIAEYNSATESKKAELAFESARSLRQVGEDWSIVGNQSKGDFVFYTAVQALKIAASFSGPYSTKAKDALKHFPNEGPN